MARVFLSYVRNDAAKARTLAGALEGAGHSVWWDSNIKGGTEYSKEIEQALNDAEAVVVLWSRNAVNSPWVRDEAAAGRDRGRLVPVRLDETDPPMGFRQYQHIDLSKWKGRGKPGGVQEVLACIDGMAGERIESAAKAPASALGGRRQWSPHLRLALMAALVLLGIAIAYFLANRGGDRQAPVLAVVAADNSPSTRSLADDLFIKLGSLQSSNADALQLVEQGSGADPDLSFKVSQRTEDGQALATVALLAKDGGLMWSREFRQERRPEADLRQQVAYSAARVLACATEAMAPGHQRLSDRTLKLYVTGCARYRVEPAEGPLSFVEIFRKVTELAPDFEGGWAKLLAAETDTLGGGRDQDIRKSLKMHIMQARKLNPTMAEAYNAEAWMHDFRDVKGWLPLVEEAVEKNPYNADLISDHSYDMFLVGRRRQGLLYARRAAQADPLSPGGRCVLIYALARVGEIEAAKDALNEAERLWPGATNLVECRFYAMAKYGDAAAALELLRTGKVRRSLVNPAMQSFLEARIDPSPAKVERAVQEARDVSRKWVSDYIDTLAEFRRKEELIKALSEYDSNSFLETAQVFDARYGFLRNDIRFMGIMKRWGSQLDYWRISGNWPDFCFEPGLPYDCKAEAARLSN